jgi:hypothetical protein
MVHLQIQAPGRRTARERGQQALRHLLDPRPGHRQHRLADALQRAAALALVGQVAEQLPQQALLHLGRQADVAGNWFFCSSSTDQSCCQVMFGAEELGTSVSGSMCKHRAGASNCCSARSES